MISVGAAKPPENVNRGVKSAGCSTMVTSIGTVQKEGEKLENQIYNVTVEIVNSFGITY